MSAHSLAISSTPQAAPPRWGDLLLIAPIIGIYLWTMNPTVYWGDGIELATASSVLGIGHPTGYPLYMILGRLFRSLPLGVVGWRFNLFSAAAAVLLAFAVYRLARALLPRVCPPLTQHPALNTLMAVACGWSIALMRDLWAQAAIAEVYLLNAAAIVVTAALIFQAVYSTKASADEDEQVDVQANVKAPWFLAAAFWTGLLMGNQLLAMCGAAALAAAIFFIFFKNLSSGRGAFKTLMKRLMGCAICGLLGLSLYAYLPLRASAKPPMNWGDPVNKENFLWVTRGGDFRAQRLLMLNETTPFTMRTWRTFAANRGQQLVRWVGEQFVGGRRQHGNLMRNAGVLIILLAFGGLAMLAWRTSVFFWAVIAAGLLNLTMVLMYNIPDIEGYFFPLAAWAALGAFCAMAGGLSLLARHFGERWLYLGSLLTLLPIWLLVVNFNEANRQPFFFNASSRGDRAYAVENYGREILQLAEPGAMVVTGGDNDIYALWYQQFVERRRLDVDVVGRNFLVRQPWYPATFTNRGTGSGKGYLKLIYLDRLLTMNDFMQTMREDFLLPHARRRPVHLTQSDEPLGLSLSVRPLRSMNNPGVMSSPEAMKGYLPPASLAKLEYPQEVDR